jgi:hypothetical protein
MKQKVDEIIKNMEDTGETAGKIIGWFKSKSVYFLYAAMAIVVIGTIAFLSKFADGYKKHAK